MPERGVGDEWSDRRTYRGMAIDANGKPARSWLCVSDDGNQYGVLTGDKLTCGEPSYISPGCIVEYTKVMRDTGPMVYVHGNKAPKIVGRHEDQAEVARWELEDALTKASIDMEAQSRRLAKIDSLKAYIDPLRAIYHSARFGQELAVIAAIVEAICKPPTQEERKRWK